ncbi:proteoglycan 4 isoform X2 [Armigeres subalbatus]|uniref:proteoglycan 4 isoform X2 n=1 Tax=Armigeres subalbatus TaxID=124917 RepID=UPI002ED0C6F3
MIGSFWNLCRACPSMPVDKLHSEYRSTYRWHEYTGGPEVVRKPPVPNQFASSKVDHFFSKSTEDDKFIEASINEPPLPRRKKCPELAYRSHEFMAANQRGAGAGGGNELSAQAGHDRPDAATTHSRARSEERGTPSRRSKSEGPPAVANGRLPTGTGGGGISNGVAHEPVSVEGRAQEKPGESSGLFKKTISKLSTEYRLQFVWPHVRRAIKGATAEDPVIEPPRKSLSMGALKAAQAAAAAAATSSHHHHHYHHHHHQAVPTVHKKRTTNEREANAHELEPLVNDVDGEKPHHEKRDAVVEHKLKAFKSEKERYGFEPEHDGGAALRNSAAMDSAWYKEVLELRKKAGEYRNRGWGGEINPDLFNKQQELWDQVSRRSSLSALSLASSVRPITKEEKEKENNKKSSPTKPYAPGRGKIPGSARPVEIGKTLPDGLAFSRSRKDNIRHHLERTTGPDVEEGALLPSPTREKLMPAIPRSKGDSPQRGSPQKTGLSRHGSPQKGSPQKSSPKKMSSRSQSVGPAVATDNSVASVGGGSPKRQIRSGSTATASTAASAAKAHNKKTPSTATTPSQPPERRPRPTTLSTTTNHSRSKSNTLPFSGSTRVHSAPPSRPPHVAINNNNINNNNSNIQNNNTTINNINNNTNNNHIPTNQTHPIPAPDRSNNNSIPNITSSTNTTTTNTTSTHPSRAKLTLGPKIGSQNRPRAASATSTAASKKLEPSVVRKPAAKGKTESGSKSAGNEDDAEKDGGVSVASVSPLPAPEINEQIIKSPPEPTRVKSPEQIIMRSPDPVNWTVPLDTGKTFTVTQNVREGDPMIRPHSEIKASTPVDHPPPAPQSAPPELSEQSKLPNTKLEPDSIKESEDEDENLPKSKSSAASSVNQPISVAVPVQPVTTVPQPAATVPSAAAQSNPEPVRFDKPVPGSTLRCLEDPDFESDINSPMGSRNVTSEVLDKARDRFDRFWGNPDGAKPDES